MKRTLTYLMGILLLCSTQLFATTTTETESNNLYTEANDLVLGDTITGAVLGSGADVDWFEVVTTDDGAINANMNLSGTGYVYFTIYDNNGSSVLAGGAFFLAGSAHNIAYAKAAAGTYYIRIANYNVSTDVTYSLTSTVVPPVEANDAEPNGTVETAVSITENSIVEGHIGFRYNGGTFDTDDYYSFTSTEDGNITLTLTNTSEQYFNLYLYDNNGITLLGSHANNGVSTFTRTGLEAGDYYIRVHYYSTSYFAGYTLQNTITSTAYENDAELNDVYTDAIGGLLENDSVYGHIGHRRNGGTYDANDWYIITSSVDGAITLTLENTTGQYHTIYLYDANGTTVLASNSDYDTVGTTKTNLAAGTYYARVSYWSSTYFSGYKLKFTLTPAEYETDEEPNDNVGTAIGGLMENDSVYGHIGFRYNGGAFDEQDWYSITSSQDGAITLNLTNNTGQYHTIHLYDANGTTSLGSHSNYGTSTITVNNLAAGNYYAIVDHWSSTYYSGYKLKYNLTPAPYENDEEPNNIYTEAIDGLMENDSVYGHIGYRNNGGSFDTDDWYLITLSTDGQISLNITHNVSMYHGVYLYDANGTTSFGNTFGYGTATFTVSNLAAGTYYAKVDSYSSGFYSGYKLKYTVTPAPYDNDPEPNGTLATASPMLTNSAVEGHIGYRSNGAVYDTEDWWEFTISSIGDVTLSISHNVSMYHGIYIVNSVGTSLGNSFGYGSASITKTDLAPGTYYAKVDNYSSGFYSGYQLTNFYCPDAITIVAEGETTLCEGESVVLSTADHHLNYLWSDGSTTETNAATLTGDFSLTIDNGSGCERTSNILAIDVTPNPVALLVADGPTEFCEGGSVIISADITATPDSYLWSTGETTATIEVSESGDYSVELFKNGCSAISDPIAITVNANPVATVTPTGVTSFCEGDSVTLNANAASSYLWSNGEATSSIIVSASGDYSVEITNAAGCTDESAITTVTVNANPIAGISADGDTEFCDGGSVNLTASGGTGYLWSNGETTATINVTSSGDYSSTVTNAAGCSDATDAISVTVNANPDVEISADGPTTFCDGGSVNLSVDSFFDILWSTGETSESINVTESGTYSVTVTDANGCSATSSGTDVTVEVCGSLVITADGPTEFCEGGNVTLTSSEESGNLWSTGETTQSIIVTETGDYTCENGVNISNTISVTVNANPTAGISADGDTEFCDGGNVNLTASGGTDYLWSTGETTATINVTSSGDYSCSVTNAEGCSDVTSTISVTVEECGTEITISADGPTEFCEGGSVTLTSSEVSGNVWSTGETTQSIIVTESGDYACTNGAFTSNTITVTVIAEPTISVEPVGPDKICYGSFVTLTAIASDGNLQWRKNGIDIPGETGVELEVTEFGMYSCVADNGVCAPVVSNSVNITYFKTVAISPDGIAYICSGGSVMLTLPTKPGVTYQWFLNNEAIIGATSNTYEASLPGKYNAIITVDGCGRITKTTKVVVNCRYVSEQNVETILWPNPADNTVYITTNAKTDEKLQVMVFDLTGKLVLQQTQNQGIDGDIITINIHDLASGMYNVQVIYANGASEQHPLVISK